MNNPWNLAGQQAAALEAPVAGGCEKKAAAILGLTRNTVSTHLLRARQKMGVTTQLQMALLWDRFAREAQ
jgi:DNA-binding NarL/FixJ family response regulator